jgi:hypothetical protein
MCTYTLTAIHAILSDVDLPLKGQWELLPKLLSAHLHIEWIADLAFTQVSKYEHRAALW